MDGTRLRCRLCATPALHAQLTTAALPAHARARVSLRGALPCASHLPLTWLRFPFLALSCYPHALPHAPRARARACALCVHFLHALLRRCLLPCICARFPALCARARARFLHTLLLCYTGASRCHAVTCLTARACIVPFARARGIAVVVIPARRMTFTTSPTNTPLLTLTWRQPHRCVGGSPPPLPSFVAFAITFLQRALRDRAANAPLPLLVRA